ncbi:MAG: OmpA family protein [Polyangiaceae bacterium]
MKQLGSLGHGALLSALGISLVACASHTRRPDVPESGDTYGTTGTSSSMNDRSAPQGRGDTASATTGSIHIDPRIVQACGDLPDPHFSFDSAAIKDQAADRLQIVARCFISGPLKGRGVKLVGRADARGSDEHNMALGHDRAASVRMFLESMGVPANNITTTSRGEIDATGTDEEGWARDRRVDVFLAD